MATRWTKEEESVHREQLHQMYVRKNMSIREIAQKLNIAYQTVFQRLQRLDIPVNPQGKLRYLNKRSHIIYPKHSKELAEFFGIMLGDGHISHFQVIVTLGNKELSYAQYVARIIKRLFDITPKISVRERGYRDVYFGSVDITRWFIENGLAHNKVKSQVGVPKWILTKEEFAQAFLRGFFDTDGSVYKLKFGIQISFTNKSVPILRALHKAIIELKYNPSKISGYKIYLTNRTDVARFFREIMPKNQKHIRRFNELNKRERVGTQVVNEGKL